MDELKNKHKGQTAWIIGKGPSLASLKKEQIGEGIVIALNQAIIKIEELGITGNVYSMYKDGGDKRTYLGSITKPDCSHSPFGCNNCNGMTRPKYATLLVHEHESLHCFPDYKPRYVFSWEKLGLPHNENSMICAIKIAELMGCTYINFIAFDAHVNGNCDTYIPGKGITEINHPLYTGQQKSVAPWLKGKDYKFVTPAGVTAKKHKVNVSYFLRDNGACGYYRATLPLETMGSKNGVAVKCITRGDSPDEIYNALDSDIIVIPRADDERILALFPKFKEAGKKVVIDHDDNMFKISPFSPHYEDLGTNEVMVRLQGEIIPMWTDKKNFGKYKNAALQPHFVDFAENKKRVEALEECLNEADMITVPQPLLADVYRQYNKNVKVLPNCVDTNIWQKLPFKEHGDVRLYWSGGSSHYEDWCILTDVLPVIMKKYSQVKLIIMGHKFDGTLKEIPKDRIEFHPWVPTPVYHYKTAILNPDIAIIPLQDNEFNRGKSAIKWIEMGALGVPCVTSYVSPYKEVCSEFNGVFVENDKEAWIEGISMLIEDKDLRKKMADGANKTVKDNFDINTKWTLWQDAYQELLK